MYVYIRSLWTGEQACGDGECGTLLEPWRSDLSTVPRSWMSPHVNHDRPGGSKELTRDVCVERSPRGTVAGGHI